MPEFAVMASTKFLCRFYSCGIIGFCAEEIAKYEKLTIKCRARCEPIKLVPELSKPRIVCFHTLKYGIGATRVPGIVKASLKPVNTRRPGLQASLPS